MRPIRARASPCPDRAQARQRRLDSPHVRFAVPRTAPSSPTGALTTTGRNPAPRPADSWLDGAPNACLISFLSLTGPPKQARQLKKDNNQVTETSMDSERGATY